MTPYAFFTFVLPLLLLVAGFLAGKLLWAKLLWLLAFLVGFISAAIKGNRW